MDNGRLNDNTQRGCSLYYMEGNISSEGETRPGVRGGEGVTSHRYMGLYVEAQSENGLCWS